MSEDEASSSLTPVLVGSLGWVAGEVFVLEPEEQVVIGRSRSCDISLRRIASYLDRPQSERDADHDFNTVSRRHLRVTVADHQAILEDLSTNGSYANETLFTGRTEVDLGDGPATIRLGTRETFRLEMVDSERLAELRSEQAEREGSQPGATESDDAAATSAPAPDSSFT